MDHPNKASTPAPDPDSALLQNLTIPISCTASWDDMKGSERVRHCGLCRKDVYNLSAMPQPARRRWPWRSRMRCRPGIKS